MAKGRSPWVACPPCSPPPFPAAATGPAAATACSASRAARRGPPTWELFTSEGLGQLSARRPRFPVWSGSAELAAPVVALAFHVELGLRLLARSAICLCRLSRPGKRPQLAMAASSRTRPGHGGRRDARDWRRTTHRPVALDPAGPGRRRHPPRHIGGQPGRQTVSLGWTSTPSPPHPAQSVAYLAVYENGQSSAVSAFRERRPPAPTTTWYRFRPRGRRRRRPSRRPPRYRVRPDLDPARWASPPWSKAPTAGASCRPGFAFLHRRLLMGRE